jgi:hypothetical protein
MLAISFTATVIIERASVLPYAYITCLFFMNEVMKSWVPQSVESFLISPTAIRPQEDSNTQSA